MSAQDEDQFTSIGGYAPSDAERLLDALRKANIKFQIECDDGIRFWPTKMGHFGQYAKIRVYVDRNHLSKATAVQTNLFGE